jgi:hypothetical protein
MSPKFWLLQPSFEWLARLATDLAVQEDDLEGLEVFGAELLCLSVRAKARDSFRGQIWSPAHDYRIEKALSMVENTISVSLDNCSSTVESFN